MNTPLSEDVCVFDEFHFASPYEHYCATLIARVPRIGRAVTARVFAEDEPRDLLLLPSRQTNVTYRRRLDPNEIEQVTVVLAARSQTLAALGPCSAPLLSNIEILGSRLNLCAAERGVLTLAVLAETVSVMRRVIEIIGLTARDRGAAATAFSALLDLDRAEVYRALLPNGTLLQTDLIRLDFHDEDEQLIRARPGLAATFFEEFEAEDALFSQFARRARAPTLNLIDFSHVEVDAQLIVGLLGAALDQREPGVNVLLYGPPGTGKTELARVVSQKAAAQLHEVRHTNADGESLTKARYAQVLLAQGIMGATSRAVLMFDETEDLFPSRGGDNNRIGKAAFNHLLETNRAPMIWISNEIKQIDPAFLRRFAFALEVKNPTRSVRKRIAHRAFGGLIADEAWIDSIAAHAALAPGQVAQAARVARLLRKEHSVAETADRTLRNGMRALGQNANQVCPDVDRFDLQYLNCNADVARLVATLSAQPSGTMVFYGPPGTGKTALARHIAMQADRPMLVKRASDLMSPWVGESERAIAQAFEEARDERAVLTIDEADSFLTDRRDARARWELTETNELLTQIESFNGLFICSTNLMERLDRAAMRRFAIKLRFDFLKPSQVARLVREELARLGVKSETETAVHACAQLTKLTPGDVAAVVRQCRMLGQTPTAQRFAEALQEEVVLKQEGGAQRIGF